MAKSPTASSKDMLKRGLAHNQQKLESVVDEAKEDAEQQNSKAGPYLQSGLDVRVPPFGGSCLSDRDARIKVRETLHLFEATLRTLLRQRESKPKQPRKDNARLDQEAARMLRDRGKYINTGRPILGNVPGVEVGDKFHYRTELMMIGLHRQSQNGIDCLQVEGKVIATSIISFGRYDNDVHKSDVMTFSGQGGNLPGRSPEDQKLIRGNLAMKNSIDKKNAVRVIRGVQESKPSSEGLPAVTRTYTYDGLYTVERYWQDVGQHGKKVYKFELKRLPDQRKLSWKEEEKKPKKAKLRERSVVDDISEGKEKYPIRVVNTIDDEVPPPFKYITQMKYPDWCKPFPRKGCNCTKGCKDWRQCHCVNKNGGEVPFNSRGQLVQDKFIVYECGPCCKSPPCSQNRVSQNGIRFPLEIFKTKKMGWGVRCQTRIPAGSFICEYVGELLEDGEADKTGNDEYLFDIGQNYKDKSLWEGLKDHVHETMSSSSDVEELEFTIDAAKYGNVGRFINHSCSPNLFPQHVLYDHGDTRMPHIMLFASDSIPALQELTYDYHYTLGQVLDKDGNIKVKNCYCGSNDCSGRLY